MWSYRFVEVDEPTGEKTLVLGEVYFNSKREPYGWCEAKVLGETLAECKLVMEMMQKALEAPIVKPGEFVEDME